MKFNYSRYNGSWLDALNLQDLLDRLADFLLDAGFAGGPHYNPWWGWSGDDADRSQGGLRDAGPGRQIADGTARPSGAVVRLEGVVPSPTKEGRA